MFSRNPPPPVFDKSELWGGVFLEDILMMQLSKFDVDPAKMCKERVRVDSVNSVNVEVEPMTLITDFLQLNHLMAPQLYELYNITDLAI